MPISVPQEELDKYTKEELAQRLLQAQEENRQFSSKVYSQREEISILKDDVKRYKKVIDNLLEQI